MGRFDWLIVQGIEENDVKSNRLSAWPVRGVICVTNIRTLDEQIDPPFRAGPGRGKEDVVFDDLSIVSHNFYREEIALAGVVTLAVRQTLDDLRLPLR